MRGAQSEVLVLTPYFVPEEYGAAFLEVRADAPQLNGAADRPLTMHTKLAVVDGRVLFVGSSNVDPRSIRQNTEIGMVIESPRLAGTILDRIDAVAADYTFEVVRGPDGALIWRHDGAGGTEVLGDEPLAGALDRLIATIAGWLPIESQL
jgi:putative cardiolipin synthase